MSMTENRKTVMRKMHGHANHINMHHFNETMHTDAIGRAMLHACLMAPTSRIIVHAQNLSSTLSGLHEWSCSLHALALAFEHNKWQ